MASPVRAAPTASIVELSRFRKRSPALESGFRAGAQLLSIRQTLDVEASVELDGLELLLQRFDEATVASVTMAVRQLLDREFGRLRVHRNRRQFVARHRSVDALIAGLLRVQFHAQQIRLPDTDRAGERVEPQGVSITWGVGRCGHEAELERLRRRRQKNLSR